MNTVGIICEYNPFHLGHAGHIEKTRQALGEESAVVGIMSGNYVQRGDFAILCKHTRAKMAVLCGVNLVIELPAPYALLSAEGFAKAGVYILDKLGICDFLSFGSESGSIGILRDAARAARSEEAQRSVKEWLDKGLSYASAQQKAADTVFGERSGVFKSPNNLLGIEYIKALESYGSAIHPLTVYRTGGDHDSETGYSASALRKTLVRDSIPLEFMPGAAAAVCMEDFAEGRGTVFMKRNESAVLSRLRAIKDYSELPYATDGLEYRFKKFAATEPTVASILEKAKTKRYTMSRLRRLLMCAVLGIKAEDSRKPPPYARILAMDSIGMKLLGMARKKTELPVIVKPASVYKLSDHARRIFNLEAAATDLYALAYRDEEKRRGGQEWRQPPVIV